MYKILKWKKWKIQMKYGTKSKKEYTGKIIGKENTTKK
jgi:hypothetical protein